MRKAVDVKALENHRIWVRFSDGLEGEIDLSDLVGQGVFESWRKPGAFDEVFVDPEAHTVAWPGGIDLCPDSLYQDILEHQKAA